MKKTKQSLPFSFSVYFWPIVILAVSGLIDSIYLSISHYRVYTDVAYRSFCAVSKAINCDTVSQSPYSIFLGVPVPVWGVVGYTLFLLFMPFTRQAEAEKKRVWPLLFLISFAFSLYSIILALISTFHIHSYCMMCILSYGINFTLLFSTWIVRRRFGEKNLLKALKQDIGFLRQMKTKAVFLFSPLLISVILLILFFPTYWNFVPPPLSNHIAHGITEDGHPWIGAENPEIVITEFTDYQCFQCKKMHFFLRNLVAKNSEKIRLVHRHYPMDHEFNPIVKQPFHIGSGTLALLGIHATDAGKFWKMNDVLFNITKDAQTIEVKELAEKVGLDLKALSYSRYDRNVRLKLIKDIKDGLKLGIGGTPSYVIDGKMYVGQIPADIIKKILS
ncbi:MAG: thioredoxin domain-containing protein [Desulfobacterales bacterium]|nr:thioredoxin domain-containing protein [Desulfobacterales bacterium]